jgi:integrase
LISGFLQHLETARGNVPKTRNLRLSAIRSLFTFASLRHPEHAHTIARVLAIPPKRHQQRTITYLSGPEAAALINAPDHARWEGRRDRTLLTLAIYTGLRVSELTALDCGDITLGTGANVRCRHSKGRKQTKSGTSHHTGPTGARRLARRACWSTRRPGIPDSHRPPTQHRRDRAAAQHPRRDRRDHLPQPKGCRSFVVGR